MLYRSVRPMRRKGSQFQYFQRRVPAGVKPLLAAGLPLDLPVGDEHVSVTLSPKTVFVKVSLRTADPAEIRIRNARLDAHLEGVWRHLMAGAPITLTNKQAVALAGRLYRAWAVGEGGERTTGVVRPRRRGEAGRVAETVAVGSRQRCDGRRAGSVGKVVRVPS